MEVAKTWVLVAAVIAVIALGAKASQQAGTIDRLQSAAATSPPPVAVAAGPEAAGVGAGPAEKSSGQEQTGPVSTTTELLAMIQERDRYLHGLERCVGELNQVTAAADRDKASAEVMARILGSSVQSPPSVPSQGRPDIVPVSSPPWVYPMGDFLLVEGNVFNRGNARGSAAVAITLNRNGRSMATARETVEVGAGEIVKWSHQFRGGDSEGAWTASVRAEGVAGSG